MNDIVTVLKGITFILSSIFLINFTVWPALILFIIGVLTCLVGFHNNKIDKE